MTKDICGLNSKDLSASANLQLSLESKLRQNLEGNGSTLYNLKWKHWDIGLQGRICALRASALRISGKDCGGWPTPRPSDENTTRGSDDYKARQFQRPNQIQQLALIAHIAGWPTPRANKWGEADSHGNAPLTGWAMPTSRDYKDGETTLQNVPVNSLLGRQVLISGEIQNGSIAGTGKRGQLAPEFTRWLMGYAPEHLNCAPMATRLSRK